MSEDAASAAAAAGGDTPGIPPSSPSPPGPPELQVAKVVIVGGGFAGASAAKSLEKEADVTLIDSKEYFEIVWAYPRALVEPEIGPKVCFPHSKYLKRATVVVGVVVNASDKDVTLSDGRIFPYDFLVLATGMKAEPTLSLSEKLAQFHSENKKLKAAGSILVVGGGPTGVELAAEIATDFPDKKVTLVHGGSRLMEFLGPKAADLALKWLQAHKVTVLLNDRVDVSPDQWGTGGTFKTKSGQEISADYVCVAIGGRPNEPWLLKSFPGATKETFLDVDPNLRVLFRNNVFAAGDIANLKDPKQGYLAKEQGLLAAENIRRMIRPHNPATLSLKKHPAAMEVGLVSLGRNDGVAQLPFGTFTGWFPTWVKSKGLFIDRTHQELGVVGL